MDWIESHRSLARHRKTRRLAKALDVSIPTAIGHLQLFWWMVAEYALDGDVSRFDAEDIATDAMWEGDADAFTQALYSVGFIDDGGRVHDWDQYVGRYTRAKDLSDKGNHARWHEGPNGKPSPGCALCVPPESNGSPAGIPVGVPEDVPRESAGISADLTYQTGPDLTDQAEQNGSEGQDRKGADAPISLSREIAAPGPNDMQKFLLDRLHEHDERWRKVTMGAVVKLNKDFTRPVVLMALQRAWEERAKPEAAYPWLIAVCGEVSATVAPTDVKSSLSQNAGAAS